MASARPFRVLVTGGTGYLGAALLRHLATARTAWELHATFYKHAQAIRHAQPHYLDLRDPASIDQLLLRIRPNLIIHTAAEMTGPQERLMQVNAEGSRQIANLASESGARLVHLSTDAIFDGTRGNYSESDTPEPLLPYGRSKYDAELGVLASGANAALVRTSLIYGFNPLDPRTEAVMNGGMPRLFTDEMRCPIFVDNLCQALIEVSESAYTGILHVAGPEGMSRYDFGVKLVRALHGDPSKLIPSRSVESGLIRPRNCTLDISRARQVLATPILTLDQVLQKTLLR